MLRVVHLDNAPGISPSPDWLAVDHDLLLRADNSERKQCSKFRVVVDSILIVLAYIVGEVVDGNAVVLDVLHDLAESDSSSREVSWTYPLFERSELGRGQGVRLSNDGDNIDSRRKPTHELDIQFSQARCPISASFG